ncbi:MAG: hypothetical protein U7127_13195 [Phormidium sp.]
MPTVKQLTAGIVAVAIMVLEFGFTKPAEATPIVPQIFDSAKLVMLVNSDNTLTKVKNDKSVSLASENKNNYSEVKVLNFADNDQFYKDLTAALKAGIPISIVTDYTNYSDFPPRLKEIIKLNANKNNLKQSTDYLSPLGGIAVGAAPVSNSMPKGLNTIVAAIPAMLNSKVLIIGGCTVAGAGIGAGIGALAGGIGAMPGTILGGAFGLGVGTVTAAMTDRNYVVVLAMDVHGTMSIHIIPKSDKNYEKIHQ